MYKIGVTTTKFYSDLCVSEIKDEEEDIQTTDEKIPKIKSHKICGSSTVVTKDLITDGDTRYST